MRRGEARWTRWKGEVLKSRRDSRTNADKTGITKQRISYKVARIYPRLLPDCRTSCSHHGRYDNKMFEESNAHSVVWVEKCSLTVGLLETFARVLTLELGDPLPLSPTDWTPPKSRGRSELWKPAVTHQDNLATAEPQPGKRGELYFFGIFAVVFIGIAPASLPTNLSSVESYHSTAPA